MTNQTTTQDDVTELCSAIDEIIANWTGGDLAAAVNNARKLVEQIRERLQP